MVVQRGECLGTFRTFVHPGRSIPARISLLTGITDALVASAPRPEAVIPSFVEFAAGSRAVRSLRMATESATYNGGSFGVALRSVGDGP